MNKSPQYTTEETLEEKLDKLNCVLKNTIQETDSLCTYNKNASVSYLNSLTTSFCNLESLDFYPENRAFSCIEENIESMFVALDRTQMQVEDFWAEKVRIDEKTNKIQEFTIKNHETPEPPSKPPSQTISTLAANLEKVQKLIKSLKNEKNKLRKIEKSLKTREENLQLKENEFEKHKIKLAPDPNFSSIQCKNLNILGLKNLNTLDSISEHDPNLQHLKKKLEKYEAKLKTTQNPDNKKKLSNAIYQITNKISSIRAEKVIQDCSKPSRPPKPPPDPFYEIYLKSPQLDCPLTTSPINH